MGDDKDIRIYALTTFLAIHSYAKLVFNELAKWKRGGNVLRPCRSKYAESGVDFNDHGILREGFGLK